MQAMPNAVKTLRENSQNTRTHTHSAQCQWINAFNVSVNGSPVGCAVVSENISLNTLSRNYTARIR